MKIAIIGAGFTGLAAGLYLAEKGDDVVIFEKDEKPGGLAVGYKEKEWDWTLEKHYHHWFTNDQSVLTLASHANQSVLIRTPRTKWYVNDMIYSFDSLSTALKFPPLPPIDRIRNLAVIGALRINPFWKSLENVNSDEILPRLMGKKAYQTLWEPLFLNKFGDHAKDISLSWFWARIKKRTQSLAYPEGGFLRFAETLVELIKQKKGNVFFSTEVVNITDNNETLLTTKQIGKNNEVIKFDRILVTLPTFQFCKMAPTLPANYAKAILSLTGIGATNLILRMSEPFFQDDTYWLSIADTKSPIMAIVEHTNFMNKKHYNNEHLVYLGNYLSHESKEFKIDKDELLKIYDPFLKKINPNYSKSLIGTNLFKAPFAQPIIKTKYSKILPPMITPLPNVFLANIQQVYPWDRGTNYAVELGEKVAKMIRSS